MLQPPAKVVGVNGHGLRQVGRAAASDEVDDIKAVEDPDGAQHHQEPDHHTDMWNRDMDKRLPG